MTITRKDAETEIVARVGAFLTELEKSTNTTGDNEDLNIPLRKALRKLSYIASSPVNNADLAEVSTADEEKFFDLCHYYTLELLSDAFTGVDWQAGPRQEKESQLGKRIVDAMARKAKQIENEHGINLGEMKTASIRVIELRPTGVYN